MTILLERALRVSLHALLYFPSREILRTPGDFGCTFEEVSVTTEDGETLGGWWIDGDPPVIGHVLFCHGNGGNISDRVGTAASLAAAGLDVLLFDYRGYGTSTGSADEPGTYRDAHAAAAALLAHAGVDPGRIFYLGESLGGAVALQLATEAPPCGLILQSTFTSIRDVARRHYPFIPTRLVPDAYPSVQRIGRLRTPLLVLHGERDETVPLDLGQALFDAAPEPKRMRVFPGLAHDISIASEEYARAIADFVRSSGRA
jgi:fermentation-respiration switch protein FrsA (DUF1100 family)